MLGPWRRRRLGAAGCCLGLAFACSGPADIVARQRGDPGRDYDPDDPPEVLPLSGSLVYHDPSIIEGEGGFYLFGTGPGLETATSEDLLNWEAGSAAFATNPDWIADLIPDATYLWSPDVSHFGGLYHLYYAASSFGSDRSCIGHATKASLTDEEWDDHGEIVCSNTGTEVMDWNAIDPSVVLDQDGDPWLVFGSFRSGLKLTSLDASGAQGDPELIPVAARPEGDNSIQAPLLVRRGSYYYLFASFDLCCMGVDSTHRIMVGRSSDVLGPYVDRDGVPMLEGGGTPVLESDDRWRGPGSNAVVFLRSRTYIFYHAYDADNRGALTLRGAELEWDAEDWPVAGGP